MTLLPVNLGMDCSASSYKALSLCATRGFCGDNVAGAIRNGVAQREGLRWEQIEGLASSLTTAIQTGQRPRLHTPGARQKSLSEKAQNFAAQYFCRSGIHPQVRLQLEFASIHRC